MSDAEIRRLPLRRFWLYSKNVDRIRSEADFRAMQVSVANSSAESFKAAHENLKGQLGTVIDFDEEIRGVREIKPIKTAPDQMAMLRRLAGQKLGDRIAR